MHTQLMGQLERAAHERGSTGIQHAAQLASPTLPAGDAALTVSGEALDVEQLPAPVAEPPDAAGPADALIPASGVAEDLELYQALEEQVRLQRGLKERSTAQGRHTVRIMHVANGDTNSRHLH